MTKKDEFETVSESEESEFDDNRLEFKKSELEETYELNY